jgi:hypothetical protein
LLKPVGGWLDAFHHVAEWYHLLKCRTVCPGVEKYNKQSRIADSG